MKHLGEAHEEFTKSQSDQTNWKREQYHQWGYRPKASKTFFLEGDGRTPEYDPSFETSGVCSGDTQTNIFLL